VDVGSSAGSVTAAKTRTERVGAVVPGPLRKAVGLALLVATSAACGAGGGSGPTAGAPDYEVHAATVGSAGTVLVDGQGMTLYLFEPDKQGPSTCSSSCAASWPPLVLPAGVAAPVAGSGIHGGLLGVQRRSDGSVQVTYDRWPLYRWIGDTRPGIATGQGLDNFGGLWYVVSPDGTAITR
jgi:predicted lipoprotein with Yx(FWY)xxD motif